MKITKMCRNLNAIQQLGGYETTDGKRSAAYKAEADRARSLLSQEQKRVGKRYKVKLQTRTIGNLRVPFFIYDLRTPSALAERISRTLRRVEKNLQNKKPKSEIVRKINRTLKKADQLIWEE